MKDKTPNIIARSSTMFLKLAVVAIGVVALALCAFALPPAWRAVAEEYPQHTYVFYWILIAMWTAAIPFLYGLYQAINILNYIDRKQVFSMLSVQALKRLTVCALIISAIYAVSVPPFYIWAQNADAPGLLIISMFLVLAPLAIAIAAAVLQRLLREVIAIKSENDLTV